MSPAYKSNIPNEVMSKKGMPKRMGDPEKDIQSSLALLNNVPDPNDLYGIYTICRAYRSGTRLDAHACFFEALFKEIFEKYTAAAKGAEANAEDKQAQADKVKYQGLIDKYKLALLAAEGGFATTQDQALQGNTAPDSMQQMGVDALVTKGQMAMAQILPTLKGCGHDWVAEIKAGQGQDNSAAVFGKGREKAQQVTTQVELAFKQLAVTVATPAGANQGQANQATKAVNIVRKGMARSLSAAAATLTGDYKMLNVVYGMRGGIGLSKKVAGAGAADTFGKELLVYLGTVENSVMNSETKLIQGTTAIRNTHFRKPAQEAGNKALAAGGQNPALIARKKLLEDMAAAAGYFCEKWGTERDTATVVSMNMGDSTVLNIAETQDAAALQATLFATMSNSVRVDNLAQKVALESVWQEMRSLLMTRIEECYTAKIKDKDPPEAANLTVEGIGVLAGGFGALAGLMAKGAVLASLGAAGAGAAIVAAAPVVAAVAAVVAIGYFIYKCIKSYQKGKAEKWVEKDRPKLKAETMKKLDLEYGDQHGKLDKATNFIVGQYGKGKLAQKHGKDPLNPTSYAALPAEALKSPEELRKLILAFSTKKKVVSVPAAKKAYRIIMQPFYDTTRSAIEVHIAGGG